MERPNLPTNHSSTEKIFRFISAPEFRIWFGIGLLILLIVFLGYRNVTEEEPLSFRLEFYQNGTHYPLPVDWFSLRIRSTAIYELLRSHFGTHQSFDQRNLWSSSSSSKPAIDKDYYDPKRRLYVYEFIADTGDGYELTYAMAKQLTGKADRIQYLNSSHISADLLREPHSSSDALVFGGDLVYPHPSAVEMLNRLIHPFARAKFYQQSWLPMDVWAIPGNHDWLDGLKTFQEIFLRKAETLYTKAITFHGFQFDVPKQTFWRCNQQKPWFIIRLSKSWYMIGLDDQIGSDIDLEQFTQISSTVQDLLKTTSFELVLVMHQPAWYPPSTVSGLRTRLLRYLWGTGRIRAIFAGDKHHFSYYRMDNVSMDQASLFTGGAIQSAHLFVAGGGGAFLHPTHTLPEQIVWRDMSGDWDIKSRTMNKQSVYPSERQSLWLSFRVYRIFATDMGILLVSIHLLTLLIPELQLFKVPSLLFILSPMLLPNSCCEWLLVFAISFALRLVDYLYWQRCKGWKCFWWIPASICVISIGFWLAAVFGDYSADTIYAGMGLTDFKNMMRIIVDAETENLIVVPIGFDAAPSGFDGAWLGKLIDGPFVIKKGPPLNDTNWLKNFRLG